MHPLLIKLKKANYAARAGQTIAGNLARGGDGKFSSAGNASAPTQPTDRQKRNADRATARATAAKAEADLRAQEDAQLEAAKPGKARNKIRMQIAAARRARANAARQARADQAVADANAPKAEKPAKEEKPKKGGGGGGGKEKPTPEQAAQAKRDAADKAKADKLTQASQTQTANRSAISKQMADNDEGLSPGGSAALLAFADGRPLDPQAAPEFAKMGLTEGDPPRLSKGGKAAVAAMNKGNYRAAVDAINGAKPVAKPIKNLDAPILIAKPKPKADQPIGQRRISVAKDARQSFAVFKDANNQDRWLAITTTAYKDQDNEYISREAIARFVAHGDVTNERGTLRYWHVPGFDLGDCDFQATEAEGRLLIESGTFRSKAAAELGRRMAAAHWQMSPGFLHPPSEPIDRVYRAGFLFERSPCPPGRASNPYTTFITKDTTPMQDDKLAALKTLTANNPELLDQLLATATKTDQQAQAQATYKDAPEWAQALISRLDVLEATVKAAPPFTETPGEGDPAVEAGAADLSEDMAEGEDPLNETDDGPLLGDADVQAIAQAVVAAIAPILDMEKKMRGHLDEMKGMIGGGIQRKDTQIAALDTRVKALEGDLPMAAGYRASADSSTTLPPDVAERLKAAPHTVSANGAQSSADPIASFLANFNLGGIPQ